MKTEDLLSILLALASFLFGIVSFLATSLLTTVGLYIAWQQLKQGKSENKTVINNFAKKIVQNIEPQIILAQSAAPQLFTPAVIPSYLQTSIFIQVAAYLATCCLAGSGAIYLAFCPFILIILFPFVFGLYAIVAFLIGYRDNNTTIIRLSFISGFLSIGFWLGFLLLQLFGITILGGLTFIRLITGGTIPLSIPAR